MARSEPAIGIRRVTCEEGVERVDAIASYFKFAERGTNLATEAKAGLTTFMVMAYILFLNPAILSNMFGAPGSRGSGGVHPRGRRGDRTRRRVC